MNPVAESEGKPIAEASTKKVSLKDRLKGKKAEDIAEFKASADPKPAEKPKEKTESFTSSSMTDKFNQARWQLQAKEIESLKAKNMENLISMYQGLTKYNPAAFQSDTDPNYYYYLYETYRYVALLSGLKIEELEAFKEYFEPNHWNDIFTNFMLKSKVDLYDKEGNTDKWDNFEADIKKRLQLDKEKTQKKEEKDKKGGKKGKKGPAPVLPKTNVNIPPPVVKEKIKEEEQINIEDLKVTANEKGAAVLDGSKEPLVMIFIGHVDSGKSTITGEILILSNKVTDTEVKKLKEEAKAKSGEGWYKAYLNDCLDEERERGKTVEMGRIDFELQKKRFTVFDCPGHTNYVQNMMAGAAQADVASLVISAKAGEFEAGFEGRGQTREHAMLARSVGVTYLVVIINKMDVIDWDKSRYEYIRENLLSFLVKDCGFEEQNIFWSIISGLNGIYIKDVPNPNPAPWFKGRTLFEIYDSLPAIQRSKGNYLRIPLLDKIKDEGSIYVYGKIESGIVKNNMNCFLMPLMRNINISEVQSVEGKKLAYAGPGESLRLVIKEKDINEFELKRGQVICGTQYWTHVCFEFEAEVKLFQLLNNQTLTKGFDFVLHLHTIMEEATISKIINKIEDDHGRIKTEETHMLKSEERGTVRIKVKQPICCEKFTDVPQMGRFVMRKESKTVASGTIVRIKLLNKETLKNHYYFMKDVEEERKTEPEEKKEPKQDAARVEPAKKVDELEDLL